MKPSNNSFQSRIFSESVEPLSGNCDPNMIQNEHVYAICYQPEVAGDIISSENVNTVEGYALLHFEVSSFSILRDSKKSFRDGGGGGGGGHRR